MHASMEDKSQEEKETFYEELESTLNSIPRNRIQIVLGDINAKVGKQTIFNQITGKHGLHNASQMTTDLN